MMIEELIGKACKENQQLNADEILQLLSISTQGDEFYQLLRASNAYSRTTLKNRGYVFVQIGLNAEPCSGNCLFCSMGASHYSMPDRWRKKAQEVVDEIKRIEQQKVDDIFLMTTADYPFEDYLEVVSTVKPLLDPHVRLVANIGDFNEEQALLLKKAGLTGAYHVNRLREGIDTSIDVPTRLKTLDIIKRTGLELYYCIEPIGKEHSHEELLTEILRARELQPEVMAVMRRVNFPSSPLFDRGMITAIELVKIAAVTNLVVRPSRAMNLHESEQMSLLAGVNQLYAEIGANPRDTLDRTELSRGISIEKARQMFLDAAYTIL